MKNPILDEIRQIRRARCRELGGAPIEALEKTRQRVNEVATDIEWLGPGVFRAKLRPPLGPQKK